MRLVGDWDTPVEVLERNLREHLQQDLELKRNELRWRQAQKATLLDRLFCRLFGHSVHGPQVAPPFRYRPFCFRCGEDR